MQRAKYQVAGFGGADGRLDRFQVAHFTDENHVRIHTQRAAQGFGEARHVDADFALREHRLLVRVVILDRVFDRDDVAVEVTVDVVQHCRQRRRLARARRPGDEEQPARTAAQRLHNRWQADLVEAQNLRRDQSQHHRDVALLAKNRDAEAALVAEREAEVGSALFLQFLLIAAPA